MPVEAGLRLARDRLVEVLDDVRDGIREARYREAGGTGRLGDPEARASPSMSSAMMTSSRLPIWTNFSSTGTMSWALLIFLSVIRM